MRETKISIITDVDPNVNMVGGIPTYINQLCNYLKSKRFKIEIIGRKRQSEQKKKIPYDKFIGIKCSSNYTFLIKLFKFLFKKVDSDIIYAQRADFMVPFIFKKGKKIIIYHGSTNVELSHKKGHLTSLIYKILERIAIRSCNKIIVVSDTLKKHLESKYSLGSKVILIPSGVDIAIFRPKNQYTLRKKYGFKPKDKIIAYIGRFSAEKQIDFIVKEVSKLKDVLLVLVGEGNFKIKNDKNIKIIKPVPHEELVDIINCADCVVLFSKYEGMPNVVLEALACGKPVVSSNVGDISKVVVNGKTGFITSRNNFTDFVLKAVSNSSRFKKNCVEMANKYSWKNIGQETIKVLSS